MRNRATTPLKIKRQGRDQIKLRQSWSKYNLYNLSRLANPSYKFRNFFQTKWNAKSVARKYHGEQVPEKQWVRMFDRRIRSVIPMDVKYLASNDGTLESAGRGSGLERRGDRSSRKAKAASTAEVPYMQMTFAPLERRLDTAIFRAMFASSARQARQFVIHGAVKVNGKEMRYSGYQLNPGDMFQVLPERVMFATGQPKPSPKAQSKTEDANNEEDAPVENESVADENEAAEGEDDADVDIERDPREILKDLQAQAKSILSSSKQDLGAKKKKDLRAFAKTVKRLLSKSSKSSTIMTDSVEAQFAELQNQLNIRRENQAAGTSSLPSAHDEVSGSSKSSDTSAVAEASETSADADKGASNLTDGEYNELLQALQSMHENPVDDSKPYATPWMPRDYMSAFAFIPRYLEVNHRICAAVYLRHPVARPGLAEVPSPFSDSVHTDAFGWYLKRR
ncbi:Small ribosomal subunit protein uS4m [Exophiala dermatitidis]